MKKAIISLGATVWLVLSCTKHAVPEYYYAVDLNQITNDELRVEMNFTGVLPDTGNFYFPRIVPGIYDAGEYDKFDFEGIRPYRSAESHFDSAVIIVNPGTVFG